MKLFTKTGAKERIKALVKKFESLSKQALRNYNEANTRKDFILPLFQALGWDVKNDLTDNEVVEEETTISGRIDYSFRINNITQFLLEAKAIPEDLDKEKWAKQAIEYGWNKGIPWVVLTDFEGLKVFNSEWRVDKPHPNLDLSYKDYLEKFEKLWLLSKKSIEKGELDEEAKGWGITAKRINVNERLAADLVTWRNTLVNDLKPWNRNYNESEIEEAVQRMLDRLIFIRVVEDRKIEDKTLWQAYQKWESKGRQPNNFIKALAPIFKRFDRKYNSNLFQKHLCEELDTAGAPFREIIPQLYGEKEKGVKYRFDAIDADVLGNVYEQYLGAVQQREGDKSKRKKQGIYYTPAYIVDYIVQNTVAKLLEKTPGLADKENIKILDPACGSGSFLIKAFEVVDEHLRKIVDSGPKDPTQTALRKYKVLTQNIYGVDLDEQAIEIARLNLLLKALVPNKKLPMLTSHMKIGNSLISDKKITDKAFDWKKEFPDVFKGKNPGFDVIIGNPPYIRIQTLDKKQAKFFNKNYKSAKGNYDIYVLFIEKALHLLKDGGILGMILPSKFIETKYGEGIRELLSQQKVLSKIVDFGDYQVFGDATTYTCLLFLEKKGKKKFQYSDAGKYLKKSAVKTINENEIKHFSVSSAFLTEKQWVFKDPASSNLMQKIKGGNLLLGEIASKILVGLQTSADPVYILSVLKERKDNYSVFSKATSSKYCLEKNILKPLLKGKEIKRYSSPQCQNVLIFPYEIVNRKANLISEKHFKRSYPATWKYLIQNKEILVKRDKGQIKNKAWFRYTYPKNLNEFESPKIITQVLANKASFTFDEDGKYYFVGGGNAGGYGVKLKKDASISYWYLLGLLNSSTLDWFLKQISTKFRGGYYSYAKRFIEQLPVKTNDSQKPIVKLAQQVFGLNKELQSIPENTDKWHKLKSEIEKLDRKIDEEVYKLYNLTLEEIKIVEENIK